jgi:hypothetical protein
VADDDAGTRVRDADSDRGHELMVLPSGGLPQGPQERQDSVLALYDGGKSVRGLARDVEVSPAVVRAALTGRARPSTGPGRRPSLCPSPVDQGAAEHPHLQPHRPRDRCQRSGDVEMRRG